MMESLSNAAKLQGMSRQQPAIAPAAAWLHSRALTLVRPSQGGVSAQLLPIQDLCGLAYRLPDFMAVLPDPSDVLPLAGAVAQHAVPRIRRGDAPPIVRSWCDLLYGLTKAGLVANIDVNASQGAGKQHSPHLQQLSSVAAQQLPALLYDQRAVAQDVSLTLLSYAYAGYTGDLGPVTQALASNPEGCLQRIEPQHAGNISWALGKLGELRQQGGQQSSMQPAAYNKQLISYLLGKLARQLGEAKTQAISNAVYGCALAGHVEGVPQLLDTVCRQQHVMARADPQHWSNTIWAAAKLGCVEQGSVLLKILAGQPQAIASAKPQEWSNTLWAAATLHQTAVGTSSSASVKLQEAGRLLLQACASHHTALQGADPQAWSNTIWAAAVLHWYDQHLFSKGSAALAAVRPADVQPQEFSNFLYACALCAHWDDKVQQLMVRVEEYGLAAYTAQNLTNTLYAWAVLSCVLASCGASQQHQGAWFSAAEHLFREAALRDVSNLNREDSGQLYTAHMCAEQLGIPGLPAGAVLEAARAMGWSFLPPTVSARQREVASVLQQLGYTTQVEMRSPDGVMSADVGVTALPDGRPCSIAVEFDGPSRYLADNSSATSPSSNKSAAAPVDRLDGPTRLRNALLQARFPVGSVCVPSREWVAARRGGQQAYLRATLAAVVGRPQVRGP
jgi:hypothetical protein